MTGGRAWNSPAGGGGGGGGSGNGGGGGGGGSGCGTPTNPTPPDSLHSEDSSYVSAKDSSHSAGSSLRVRFSPVAASVSGDGRTLLDIPVQGQSQDYTIPLKVIPRQLLSSLQASVGTDSSRNGVFYQPRIAPSDQI